jgi:hypothetical protein
LVLVETNAAGNVLGNEVKKCLLAFACHIGQKRGNHLSTYRFKGAVEIAEFVGKFRRPFGANPARCPLPFVRCVQSVAHFIAEPAVEF